MYFYRWLFFAAFAFFITTAHSYKYSYSNPQLNVGVWLSGAAYCGKDAYPSMTLAGPASGFEYVATLYDVKTDLQGFVGALESTKTLYVVLRGSSSTMNWLDDFEVKLVPYTSFPECAGCNVHYGFYRSGMAVANQTVDTLYYLIKQYPEYSLVVTGHSYGAACAQIIAMELVKSGIVPESTNLAVYNYGQPRVGDVKYAAFVNSKIGEYFRTTHNRDVVPHVPPQDVFGYAHSCREIFEAVNGTLTECSATDCEDPKCADQFRLVQTNSEDHSTYLGHRLSCEESTK